MLEYIREQLLLEKNRKDLIDKSKKSDQYKDTSKGKNRWERRNHSRIAASVADYNKIDMNAFWKGDILEFGINVHGETDDYVVTVIFEHILDEIRQQIKMNNMKLEFKCILKALVKVFNSDDVYIHCTCPDFTYRQDYWATQGRYNAGLPQMSNGKGIANPNDTKGAGCKHVNLVLGNLDWLMKIASVINNYIYYCKDNMENNYAQYIFPKIYGMPYDKAVQLTFNDFDADGNLKTDLATSPDDINLANALGKRRTQYKPKGETSVNPRFSKKKEEPEEEDTLLKGNNPLGIKFADNKKELIPDEEEQEQEIDELPADTEIDAKSYDM